MPWVTLRPHWSAIQWVDGSQRVLLLNTLSVSNTSTCSIVQVCIARMVILRMPLIGRQHSARLSISRGDLCPYLYQVLSLMPLYAYLKGQPTKGLLKPTMRERNLTAYWGRSIHQPRLSGERMTASFPSPVRTTFIVALQALN